MLQLNCDGINFLREVDNEKKIFCKQFQQSGPSFDVRSAKVTKGRMYIEKENT